MSLYNKYYKKDKYFGEPYPELIEYFKTLNKNLKVLDIGCGQGRDTLALGRLGFNVTGIDLSYVGIRQLNEVSHSEGLYVKAIVGDFNDIDNLYDFDIVLLDSMFHFYKKDLYKELAFLRKLIKEIKVNGRLVIIIQESPYRIKLIKKEIKNSNFHIEYEESIVYKEFDSMFYIFAMKKTIS